MDLISVVIPIFNAEKYLKDCILSVLKQTYSNLEIILVNDGSTDTSLLICNEFCELDTRIRCINQKNAGVSVARNNGKKNATGKYIIFVDSDDTLQSDMIQCLYEDILKSDSEISVCGINEYSENNTHIVNKIWSGQIEYLDKEMALESLLLGGKIKSGAWNKLFLYDLIRDLDFTVGKRMNEDKYFCFHAIMRSKSIVYRNNGLYNYIYHDESVAHSGFDDRWFDAVFFADKMHKECYVQSEKLEKIARSNYITTMFYVLMLMHKSELRKSYEDEWKKYILTIKALPIYDIREYISYKRRIAIYLMKISTKLFEGFIDVFM
ncbi:glycosyltransferase [Anaerobutyricum soehngenii]|uniref:glycosyltransferase n=1 Tax=Anaerobutyricum soehngenii TaxID=105843 RepID=UPI003D7A423D